MNFDIFEVIKKELDEIELNREDIYLMSNEEKEAMSERKAFLEDQFKLYRHWLFFDS